MKNAWLAVFLMLGIIKGAGIACGAEAPAWETSLYHFLDYQEFLGSSTVQYYPYEWNNVRFSLFDMNRDGLPELLIYNASPDPGDAADYVYTYQDGFWNYVGEVGICSCELYYFEGTDYPGLLCTDGDVGYWRTFYYELSQGMIIAHDIMLENMNSIGSGGSAIVTRNTEDETLFELARFSERTFIKEFTYEEVIQDWDVFLEDCAQQISLASGAGIENAASSAFTRTPDVTPFYGIWCAASKDYAQAKETARQLDTLGFAGEVLLTTDWSNFNKEPWYVVTAGRYANSSDAEAVLPSIRLYWPDAYVKYSGESIH